MIIFVKVRPGSKKEKIEKISEGEYVVSVKEPAENNRANKKVVNLLAKEFGVSFQKVKIKNPTSRRKIVEIR